MYKKNHISGALRSHPTSSSPYKGARQIFFADFLLNFGGSHAVLARPSHYCQKQQQSTQQLAMQYS
jgi:hypothetical protein